MKVLRVPLLTVIHSCGNYEEEEHNAWNKFSARKQGKDPISCQATWHSHWVHCCRKVLQASFDVCEAGTNTQAPIAQQTESERAVLVVSVWYSGKQICHREEKAQEQKHCWHINKMDQEEHGQPDSSSWLITSLCKYLIKTTKKTRGRTICRCLH